MDELTQKKFVNLYNDAVLKIFPTETMNAIFGDELTMDTEGNNKMTLPINPTSVQEKTTTKKFFLNFMEQNFPDFDSSNDNSTNTQLKLIKVNENVGKFIQRMEVKAKLDPVNIVVTLHDIIDKLSSTEFGSEHCVSEKVFMAILLAIRTLCYPNTNYNLTFQFSKSLFGKSGLERSSVICSGNRQVSSSNDPVDEAKRIFDLNLDPLKQEQAQEVEEDNPAKLLEPKAAAAEAPLPLEVEEEQPATMLGDELFKKKIKIEDPLPEEIDTYQKIVLQKFKEGKYQFKSIKNWYDADLSKELNKREGIRSEVLNLLSITPNGDVYKKLFYLVHIFTNLNCKDEDCLKIYLLTAHLLSQGGGSKSRRKPVRKTRRGRGRTRKSKSKSKSKSKTHRHRRHSRVRKHKKYTSRRR